MPINIFDLTQDRKNLPIELSSGILNVTYRPNALTPARELAILRAIANDIDDDDSDAVAEAERNIRRQIDNFVELVEAWDFEGPLAAAADGTQFRFTPQDMADVEGTVERAGGTLLVSTGQVIPIKVETLQLLPSTFLMLIGRRINEDMSPNPKRKRT